MDPLLDKNLHDFEHTVVPYFRSPRQKGSGFCPPTVWQLPSNILHSQILIYWTTYSATESTWGG